VIEKRNSYQPRSSSVHPMDCADIVIGTARGSLHRVYDAYTRDRSTPMRDSFYGGEEDLTGACAFEDDDGFTTVAFQKKLTRNEPTDHTITKGLTHVIWAMGQQEGDYAHKPDSGLEKGNPSVRNFYREDEVKYHGRKNRGVSLFDFYGNRDKKELSTDCSQGTYKFPTMCSSEDCDYIAQWKNDGKGHLKVIVKQKHATSESRWAAIAFSNNKIMPKTDIVAGYLKKDGSPYVGEFYAPRYGPPKEVSSSNIKNPKLVVADGLMVMSFEKSLSSPRPKSIPLDTVHLMFPFSGGPVFGANTLGMHTNTPFVTSEKVNLKSPC